MIIRTDMELKKYKLGDIADYVCDKIDVSKVSLADYVTTDSMLPNKAGCSTAQNLPPKGCLLTRYKTGDILIANIRPYLQKIWLADRDGGASADVLVFRAKSPHKSSFLYSVLLQDSFFDYVMKGTKGSKMPRGDKNQIMRFPIPSLSIAEEDYIGNIILSLNQKIAVNRQINDNLPMLGRSLRGAVARHAA